MAAHRALGPAGRQAAGRSRSCWNVPRGIRALGPERGRGTPAFAIPWDLCAPGRHATTSKWALLPYGGATSWPVPNIANARASAQPPGSPAGVLGATTRAPVGPADRRQAAWEQAVGVRKVGVRGAPRAWAGRPDPGAGQKGSATPAAKGQPQRAPSAAPAAVQGCDARGPPPVALRGACTACPTEEKGATAPGVPTTTSVPGSRRGSLLAAIASPPRVHPAPVPRVCPPAAPSRPRAGLWPRPRLTCKQQTSKQRAQQDPGVPAADHGERDAACLPGPRAARGPQTQPPESVFSHSRRPPRAPLSAAPARETNTSPGNPRSSASSGRCAPIPEPAPSHRRRRRRRGGAARSVRPARSEPSADLD